jgi:hypothetical protein
VRIGAGQVGIEHGLRHDAGIGLRQPAGTKAGTFQTFKIEYDGRYFAHQSDQSWTGSHKETAWFAPGINQFVKRELEQRAPGRNFLNHHVIELVSFKPAP